MTAATLPTPRATDRRAPNAAAHRRPSAAGDELAEARIDLDAIAANTRWFADRAAGARLMAVVKADGFGHGAVPVAATALAAGATWLGVARLREGLALRAAGLRAPILAWLLEPACLRDAIDAGIDLSASSAEDLDRIAAAGATARPQVHLKLDTGLHRAGVPLADWPAVVDHAVALERRGRLRVRGAWSHLSHGDVPDDPHTAAQRRALEDGIGLARAHGLDPHVTHLANGGGVIQDGSMGGSLVRVGAGLYGIDGLAGIGPARRLLPAMTLTARVVGVRDVEAGEGVGYGHAWVARRRTRLALVPLGYADGLPRVAGSRARMAVGGAVAPVVGRISMDQAVLDVGGTAVRVGDLVTAFGDGPDGTPSAADWAAWAGTIPHEILAGIGPRVVRRYAGGPAEAGA